VDSACNRGMALGGQEADVPQRIAQHSKMLLRRKKTCQQDL